MDLKLNHKHEHNTVDLTFYSQLTSLVYFAFYFCGCVCFCFVFLNKKYTVHSSTLSTMQAGK